MSTPAQKPTQEIDYIGEEEGRAILDRKAREFLGMSGEEFIRAWRAGEFDGDERPEVERVAMFLSLGR